MAFIINFINVSHCYTTSSHLIIIFESYYSNVGNKPHRAGCLLPAVLHLLPDRKKTSDVPPLQQASLSWLSSDVDRVEQTGMSALQEGYAAWQFCRLRALRQRHQASLSLHVEQLKNERKMHGSSHRDDLLLRRLQGRHLFRLRHVRQGTKSFHSAPLA